MAISFDVHKLEGFDDYQKELFMNLLQTAGEVLNSSMFTDRVLNFTWTRYYRRWFKTYSTIEEKFHDTDDTNAQVLEKLLSGADELNPARDGDIDLFLCLYYKANNVIGYTNPGTNEININKFYFLPNLHTKQGKCDIVNNVVHEYMHKVGYGHSYFNNAYRPYSVPYAVGNLAGECMLHFLNGKV
jgi:hypothetical protein